MTKDKRLAKVKNVYLENRHKKARSGKWYKYLRWIGYYQENGKQHCVYIGSILPQNMKHLARAGRHTTPEMFE